MENWEWRIENGELRMGNGEWRMGNGKWGMENGELGMGNYFPSSIPFDVLTIDTSSLISSSISGWIDE